MSLYVYCIGEQLRESAFEGLTGIGRARVRVLELGALAAVVSEAVVEAMPVNEENLEAHTRVNATALAVTTPLPCRFGTRVAAERLAEYVSSNEASLVAALARVRGCVEMSVKIMMKAEVETEGDDSLRPLGAAVELGAKGAGTAFLLKKRREILGEEDARRRADEGALWLASGVGELARETAERFCVTKSILVAAAHLVERGLVEEYRRRLRALAAERRDLRLLASGPWPPYNFSDIISRQ